MIVPKEFTIFVSYIKCMLKLTPTIDLYLTFFSSSLLCSSGVDKELQGVEAKSDPPIH